MALEIQLVQWTDHVTLKELAMDLETRKESEKGLAIQKAHSTGRLR